MTAFPSPLEIIETGLVFLLAVVAGIGIFTYSNVEKWTPLRQWYWTEYLTAKSGIWQCH
ncbi:MAG: hypothetical protein WBV31_03870 [Terriglobales bacterium]